MKKQIIFIIYLITLTQVNLYSDQDINRYYGRMGLETSRYYGFYEKDTPSRSSSSGCIKTNSDEQDVLNDIPENIVVVKSDTDKKYKNHYGINKNRRLHRNKKDKDNINKKSVKKAAADKVKKSECKINKKSKCKSNKKCKDNSKNINY